VISDNLTNDVWMLLQEERSKNVALIVDSNVAEQQDIKEITNFLENKINLLVYKIKSTEPTTDMVNEYTTNLRMKDIDIFIGVGGGSIIDLTKALSVMVVNEGKVEDYHGTGKLIASRIKKIMIPTTAGTGSEVTCGAVLVNTTTKFKRAINGGCVTPDYAVLNAKLTLTMPDSVIASTGIDALGHAIESYTAKCANDITRMYSKKAFALVYNNLSKIFEDKQNIVLRQNVLLGSCLAGYAIYNSDTGACHSMAYPLGIYNDIPHGVAVAYILPHVIRINVERGCSLYADLYDLMDDVEKMDNLEEKIKRFCACLENYKTLSFIDKNFKDYGINENNYEFLAERGLDLTSALNNNPVDFGLEDAKRVLRELL
jgi:alcohol dehydrogenase